MQMNQVSDPVSMHRHLTKWMAACKEKPEELPALFAMIGVFADKHRAEIASIYPEMGDGNLSADIDLESSAAFGCVTDDMLNEVFSGPVARTLICMKNIELGTEQAKEHRDYALAFLWGRCEHIGAHRLLGDLVKPFTSSVDGILAQHHEALRGAGHDVDHALLVIGKHAAQEHSRLWNKSIEEMGLGQGRLETMSPRTATTVSIAGLGSIAEYEAALREELNLPSLDDKYDRTAEPGF